MGRGIRPQQSRASGDAEMFFEVRPVGSGVAGGMDGAAVCDGLWIHRELDALDLRDQIRDVLAGRKDRIELVERFPRIEGLSVAEARRFRDAIMMLYSTRQRRLLVTCPVSVVGAGEDRLFELIRELDVIAERETWLPPRGNDADSRGRIEIQLRGAAVNAGIRLGWSDSPTASPMLEKHRAAIEAIIRGEDISLV